MTAEYQQAFINTLLSVLNCGCDVIGDLKFLPPWLLCNDGQEPGTVSQISPCFLFGLETINILFRESLQCFVWVFCYDFYLGTDNWSLQPKYIELISKNSFRKLSY